MSLSHIGPLHITTAHVR